MITEFVPFCTKKLVTNCVKSWWAIAASLSIYTEASAGRRASHSFQTFFLSLGPNKRHTNICQRYVFQPDKYWTLKINYDENDLQFNALRSRTREAHIALQHGRLLFCFNDALSVPRVIFTLTMLLAWCFQLCVGVRH